MQKITTENDITHVMEDLFGLRDVKVTLPLADAGLSAGQIRTLTERVNELFDADLSGDQPGDVSAQDIAEQVNREKGWDEMTIADFFDGIAAQDPEMTALLFDGERYSYRRLREFSESLAANLYRLGLRKGDRAAIILSNRIEFILLYLALFRVGACPVPINTRWGQEEVYNVLGDAGAVLIAAEERIGAKPYGAYVRQYAQEHPEVRWILRFGDEGEAEDTGAILFSDLLEAPDEEVSFEKIEGGDIAMLSYTSGTTGLPKGVMLKNRDIVKISAYTAQTWTTVENEYPFSIAPLYSAQGFLSLLINIAVGKTFKMTSTFNPNEILKEISKGENTIVHTQPTMWSLLLNCRIINFTRFDSLNKLVVSGSLCSPELARQIEEKIGCTLLNAYGLIEATSVVTMTRMTDPYEVRINTVGRPIPGVKIKIVDENRQEIPRGEIGELAVKGYTMQGYYNNEAKTAEVMDDEGWLYTGDLARYYDDENISIVGRCKDMIIRGGFNVYPSDIEEYLLRIPGVQNAAVVGRDHPVLGEEIVAFILPKPGVALTKNDILRSLFHDLANYKMPDKVEFISEMPTILAGKIDKKVLHQWAEKGVPADKQVLFKRREEKKVGK